LNQLDLFRLPRVKKTDLTRVQHEVLAWVEFSQGRVSIWPRRFQTQTLRLLINTGLVKVTALSPARYMLTPLGRAVRSKHGSKSEWTRPGHPSFIPMTERLFFRDSAAFQSSED
jgi:hypothetical protein